MQIDIHRVRVDDAARELDTYIASVTGTDPPAGSWKRAWYSATAWTVLDQTRGALPGRSDASPAIFVVLPPPDPPVLPPLLIGTGSRASAARAWRCAAPRSQSASPTLPGRWANTK